MTMKSKMLRVVVASVAGLAAAIGVLAVGGQPGAAVTCQRSVAIDPQVTASEMTNTLTFTVHTGSCAAAGQVSYVVNDGSARRPGDFLLANGQLQWSAGDTSSRRITAVIVNDAVAEALLEDFTITLVNPSQSVRVPSAVGQGRIFDNDTIVRAGTVDSRLCLVGADGMRSTSPSTSPAPTPIPTGDPVPCTIEPGNIVPVPFVINSSDQGDQAVFFETMDGDLIADIDYVPVRRTVIVPAGVTVVYVEVQLLPHAFTQSGKHFYVKISNYSAGVVVAGIGRVTVWH